MSSLFLDTSALAKRYLPEQGTRWLRQQIDSANTIIVSRLTLVEVMSAVARRHRDGTINTRVMQGINRLLERHFHKQYAVVDVNDKLTLEAVRLIITHPLRAYDSVQLASALLVNQRLLSQKLSPITFLCSDTRLLQIATSEGLVTDDPNNYA